MVGINEWAVERVERPSSIFNDIREQLSEADSEEFHFYFSRLRTLLRRHGPYECCNKGYKWLERVDEHEDRVFAAVIPPRVAVCYEIDKENKELNLLAVRCI